MSGNLRSSTDYYPSRLEEPTENLVPYLLLDVSGKQRLSKRSRLQWKIFALGNLESESQPEKIYGDIPEGFFEHKVSDLRLRLGMNTLNWGVVDVTSPSDVTNTTAFFHPLRTYKRGAPMVEFEWKQEIFGAHLIFVPVQQRPLLPSQDSRWLPRTLLINTGSDEGRILLPETLEYQFDRPDELNQALKNNYDARLTSHVGSFDLSVMYFNGAFPSPKVRATVVADPGNVAGEYIARSPIHLQVVSYRVQTTGAGLVYAAESFIARFETAYQDTITKGELVQPWAWASVAALETNVDVGTATATVLAQYYYTQNPQSPDNLISSSYRLFDRTPVLGVRFPYNDETLITGSILYESNTKGIFWMLGFENKLSDVLKWGLGYRDFSAQEDGLIKTFDKNDHATMDLTYYF